MAKANNSKNISKVISCDDCSKPKDQQSSSCSASSSSLSTTVNKQRQQQQQQQQHVVVVEIDVNSTDANQSSSAKELISISSSTGTDDVSNTGGSGDGDDTTGSSSSAGVGAGTTTVRDNKLFCSIEAMADIEKSPYEPNESAEVGEPIFDDLTSLLYSEEQEPNNGPKLVPPPDATKYFGQNLAKSLVNAYDQIGKSGMLFSPAWQEGKIRGLQCGWIPKGLLLLCLHEQRFIRANEAVLMRVITDLGVCKFVFDALKEWKLEDEYMNLTSNHPSLTYVRQKKDCYKCEIFVARAYRCAKAMKRSVEDPSPLMSKIKQCLAVMNENAKVNKRRLAEIQQEFTIVREKKRQKMEKKRRASADAIMKQQHRQQEQRERRLQIETEKKVQSAATEVAAIATATALSSSSSSSAVLQVKRRAGARQLPQQERQQSLDVLLDMFQEQYKCMGETLKVLQQKVKDHREQAAHEIRNEVRRELLEEMKNNTKGGGAKIGLNKQRSKSSSA